MPTAEISAPQSPNLSVHQSPFDSFMQMQVYNYKGSVSFRWKAPQTEKQFINSIRNLLRFWNRLTENGIYSSELIDACQKLAHLFITFMTDHPDRYVPVLFGTFLAQQLQSIVLWKIPENLGEIINEKKRNHERAVCSMCKVNLVYPAIIVARDRKSFAVTHESAPTGIHCLTRSHGKLNDLITELERSGTPESVRENLEWDLSRIRQTKAFRSSRQISDSRQLELNLSHSTTGGI